MRRIKIGAVVIGLTILLVGCRKEASKPDVDTNITGEATIAPTEEATTAEPTVPSTEETTEPTTTESATESTTTETETEASTEGTTEETTTAPSTEETTITPTTVVPTQPTTVPTTTVAPTKPVETEPVTQATTKPAKPTEAPTKPPVQEPTKPAVKLTGITATVSGTFNVGDTLKASDFTVTAKYSDGTTKKNPAGWSADTMTLKSTSNKITVTYNGFTTTVTVAAKEKPKANTITTVEGTTKNLNDYTIMNIGGATRTYSPDKSIWYETYEYCDPWSQEYIYKYSDGKWYDEDYNMPIFKFTESNYKNKIINDKILNLDTFDYESYDASDFEQTYYVMAANAADRMADKNSPIKAGDVLSFDKHEFEVQNILREMCGVPRLTWDDQMYKDIQHHSKRVYEHDFSDGANPHRVSNDFGKDDPGTNHGAWENIGSSTTALFGSCGHRAALITTRSTYGTVSFYKYDGDNGVFWYSKNR